MMRLFRKGVESNALEHDVRLRIPPDLYEALNELATAEQITVEALLLDLIADNLEGRWFNVRFPAIWESLTAREREVIAFTSLGLTNKEIGQWLNISAETVKTHLKHSYRKFGIRSKSGLREMLVNWRMDQWLIDNGYPDILPP